MKTAAIAIAASALLAGADARSFFRRHAHANAHLDRRDYGYAAPSAESDVCKVVTYTTWVEYQHPATKPAYTKTEQQTVTVVPVPSTTECPVTTVPPSYAYPVPTPEVTTCEPGTYTFPEKTITLTKTETLCVPTSTILPPGTHTYGYTTTVVPTSTIVTCPYATTYTSDKAVYTTLTSTILSCPSAGTYTVGGYTTTITETKTCEYPQTTVYTPGKYTHPATTITVTKTVSVVTCPYAPYVAPTPTYVPPAPETKVPVAPVTYEKPTPKETYAPKPKPTPKTSYKPTGPLGEGKQWAITYSQYNDDESCKVGQIIYDDIKNIKEKGFRAIRVYAPDCDALETIGKACEQYGVKLILGVFIRHGDKDTGFSDVYKQIEQISAWKKWHLVEILLVGNEAVFSKTCEAGDLIYLIGEAKTKFRAAGYTGLISTSETTAVLESHPEICGCVDVVGVNVQPFFDGKSSSLAGDFVSSQLARAKEICGGQKPAYCFETGWPSQGSNIASAYATEYDQSVAIHKIGEQDQGGVVYHSYLDNYWRNAEENGGVERYFGCGKYFGAKGGY